MKEILAEIKDSMIPQNQQDPISNIDFYIPNDPSCPLTQSTPFNWNKFYESLSLSGLQLTEAYSQEFGVSENYLRQQYSFAANSLSKKCN